MVRKRSGRLSLYCVLACGGSLRPTQVCTWDCRPSTMRWYAQGWGVLQRIGFGIATLYVVLVHTGVRNLSRCPMLVRIGVEHQPVLGCAKVENLPFARCSCVQGWACHL